MNETNINNNNNKNNNKSDDCCKAITTVITDIKGDGKICNKIKLCGYLKKKRNKVGGWRKLWFVLQDKLLLSYGSKEEYDNKLVSFKDVLNLVPGTMVRPLGGFRFTIETTSQAMYTFHCDDRIAYREWMSMLLDSLSTTPQQQQQHQQQFNQHNRLGNSYAYDKNIMMMTSSSTTTSSSSSASPLSASSSLSTPLMEGKLPLVKAKVYGLKSNVSCSASMDSIPYVLDHNLLKCNASLNQQQQQLSQPRDHHHRHVFTTRSYESISQVEHNADVVNSVTIAVTPAATAPATPIAAAALETKLKSKSTSLVYSTTSTSSSSSLSSLSLNPVSCVRMPAIAQSTLELLERNKIQKPNNVQSELHMFCNRKTCCHDLESHRPQRKNPAQHQYQHYQHQQQQQQQQQQQHMNAHRKMKQNEISPSLLDNNSNKIVYSATISGTTTTTTAAATTTTTSTCKTIDLVKDHIQRLSIRGSTSIFKEEQQKLSPLEDLFMTKQQQRHSCLNMTTSTNVEQMIKSQQQHRPKNNNNINCLSCQLEQQAAASLASSKNTIGQQSAMPPQSVEPVYAVVNLQHKYAQRRLRSNSSNSRTSSLQQTKRSNSYDSIIQFSNNNKGGSFKDMELKRSSLAEDIDGIYEDGDKLFCHTTGSNGHYQMGDYHRCSCHEDDEQEDEENIYEPINIPASVYAHHQQQPQPRQQQQHQSHPPNRAFWKYLSRLKVKPFLHLTRLSKRNHSPDYDVIKLPPSLAVTTTNNDADTAAATVMTSATTSHFANFRHKFGTQRKSIRARMRKLCVRATPSSFITSGAGSSTGAAVASVTVAGYEPKPFCSDTSTKNETKSSTPAGAKGYGKHKKFRNRWRTVKLRPRNAVGIVTLPTTSTDEPIIRSGRRFFGGSLPHIRKTMPRVSLFAAQQVQPKPKQLMHAEEKSDITSRNNSTSSSSNSSPKANQERTPKSN